MAAPTPKYTESKDGRMRTTVTLHVRLTEDEYAALERYARAEGFRDVTHVCGSEAGLAVEGLIYEVQHKAKYR